MTRTLHVAFPVGSEPKHFRVGGSDVSVALNYADASLGAEITIGDEEGRNPVHVALRYPVAMDEPTQERALPSGR